MTITIHYHEQFKNETIYSYTYWWATDFGNIKLVPEKNSYILTSFSDTYPPPSGPSYIPVGARINHYADSIHQNESKAAIIMEYKLVEGYPFTTNLQSLSFGKGLFPAPEQGVSKQPQPLQLQQVELSISGLDIWSDVSRSTTHLLQDQDTQDVQNLGIYNLLKGNANPLLNILQSQGINVDTPLKDMAIASQFDVIADAPIIDIVGENDGSDILLVA